MSCHPLFTLAGVICLSTAGLASAAEPILTVRTGTNEAATRHFDMAALDLLPQQSFATSTVWTTGVHQFSGPSLKTVLDSLGAQGATVHARALNDYAITIPFASLSDTAPIIATRIDGQPYSRREKGPLWIMYPFDSDEGFHTETIYGRSIWQLRELAVE